MKFERTTDLELVRSILTHPKIYPLVGDDFAPPREEFVPNEDPRIFYVPAMDEGDLMVGLFMFCPQNNICWDGHVAMLPEASAAQKWQAAREVVPWLWRNTQCLRLVASIPVTNRAAIIFGTYGMGLRVYGRNRASYLKNGKLIDQILIGTSKSSFVECGDCLPVSWHQPNVHSQERNLRHC